MASKRIYLTTVRSAAEAPAVERLVRAATQAQATGHVTRSIVTTKVAEQDDLVRLAGAGVKVEDAGDAPGEPVGP